MSVDRRTVATDALDTLGMIIDESQGRDAIHLAVEPSIAADPLHPGQHVGLVDGGVSFRAAEHIGIVDPFLAHRVEKGQRFWLVIYPRQITSLRHVWVHPAFDGAEPRSVMVDKAASEEWLRRFIATADCPDFDTVIAAATGGDVPIVDSVYGPVAYKLEDYGDGLYLYFGGRDAHGPIPPEFWDHLEVYTGRKFAQDKRAQHFTCSC